MTHWIQGNGTFILILKGLLFYSTRVFKHTHIYIFYTRLFLTHLSWFDIIEFPWTLGKSYTIFFFNSIIVFIFMSKYLALFFANFSFSIYLLLLFLLYMVLLSLVKQRYGRCRLLDAIGPLVLEMTLAGNKRSVRTNGTGSI